MLLTIMNRHKMLKPFNDLVQWILYTTIRSTPTSNVQLYVLDCFFCFFFSFRLFHSIIASTVDMTNVLFWLSLRLAKTLWRPSYSATWIKRKQFKAARGRCAAVSTKANGTLYLYLIFRLSTKCSTLHYISQSEPDSKLNMYYLCVRHWRFYSSSSLRRTYAVAFWSREMKGITAIQKCCCCCCCHPLSFMIHNNIITIIVKTITATVTMTWYGSSTLYNYISLCKLLSTHY